MCGLAGFAGLGNEVVLQRMTAAVTHRGPDGSGTYVDRDRKVFLGHRRLSVIDIEGGHQPMWNAAGTLAVIYNGEIYNHRALRAELEARGHRFVTSHCDTEVLIHGFAEWGAGLPERLNGMFAFAIYDVAPGQLFLARDRFGEKPLYYCAQPGMFAFASEMASLLEHPQVSRELDARALQKLFAWGYLPAPNALYKGCRKLPGGHWARYDIATGTLNVTPYWQFELMPDESLGERDEARLAEELRHLVFQAVERRLISDVPLGLFLSGGLDSSSALAGAVQASKGNKPQTFCIGFDDPSFDESRPARAMAEHLGSVHHERILDFARAEQEIPRVLAHMREPIGDASVLPTYLLSRFARETVTVALSGDGGDELLAGYDPFKALAGARVYSALMPGAAHRGLRKLADLLPKSQANMSFDFKLRRALRGLSYRQGAWNPAWMSPLEPAEIREVFEAPLSADELYAEALELWERRPGANLVDRSLEFFTRFYLPDDILTKTDRASMMVSLETRAVFLDNDLVSFCQRLPHHFKFRNGSGKYLLKKAMTGVLPQWALERPKKGFGIPVMQWLKDMPEFAGTVPLPGLRAGSVETAWQTHRAGHADHRLFLWQWLALQYGVAGEEA